MDRPLSYLSQDLLSEALTRVLRHAWRHAGRFDDRRGVWIGPHPLPIVWLVLDEWLTRARA